MAERTRQKMGQKTITEFLNREYREFALYSIQNRAIASVIDGFKPVARKIVFTSSKIWKTSGQKPMKIFQLSGKVSSESFYHHGSSSLDSAIIQMAQRFKNNLPLLEEHGQFGSLRSTEASAPRYIATRLSPIFWSLYKDERLLDYLQEEGQEIEPRFYLPIIPTILVNGGSGIAVGFSSNILNRPPLDVLEAVIGVIEGKEIKPLTPSINGFVGNFIRDVDNSKRWIIRGIFKHLSKATTQILEIPPSFTWEKYEELLDDLTQKGIIQSWEDNCKEDINYTVRWTTQSQGFLSDDEWVTKCLKLEEYSTEIFTTLDEGGNLKIFESDTQIIQYFTHFRLGWYEKRKKLLIQDIEREILQISQRVRFIKCVISGEIHIMNVPKKTLNDRLVELEFIKIEGSYEYLLRLPISSLVKEVWEKLQLELEEKKRERETLIQKTIKGMYLSDLLQLKKDLKAKQI
jgi:DNA topoisomerase-2